jgi:ABC-2 type transport system permease protein
VSETLIIIRREFRQRVSSRSFMIGTLLLPLFMAALIVIPTVVRGGGVRRIAVVNEAAPAIGERFVEALTVARDDTAADNRYLVERVSGTLAAVRDDLNRRVLAEELHGYVVIPPDVLERGEVQYRARSVANMRIVRDLRTAVSRGVQAERLRLAGLQVGEVVWMLRAVDIASARITPEGEEGGGATSTFLLAYIVAFLIYMMTTFYGIDVLRSVLEEKTNRIAEVMVSSVRANHLMAGKVLGVGSAALLQVAIWVALTAIVATQSTLITERFGLPPNALRVLQIDPGVAVLLVTYFVLGFFLFASIFAAVGAAVNSEQEAQGIQFLVLVPLFIPLILLSAVTGDPRGQVATVLGLIPFTAPIAMPMRLAAGDIPPLEVASSIVLLLLALGAVAWMAGKIYRIGILSTGKKPTMAELVRWVRTA